MEVPTNQARRGVHREDIAVHVEIVGIENQPRVIAEGAQHFIDPQEQGIIPGADRNRVSAGQMVKEIIAAHHENHTERSGKFLRQRPLLVEKEEVREEERQPDHGDFLRAEAHEETKHREEIERRLRPTRSAASRSDAKQPRRDDKIARETVRPPGDVGDRGVVDGMHHPYERDNERQEKIGVGGVAGLAPVLFAGQPRQQRPEQEVQQKRRQGMVTDVRKMIAKFIREPEPVIEHVGDVLDRAVIEGERVEKEVVPENLENEDRTLEKWVSADKPGIVVEELAIQGCPVRSQRSHEEEDEGNQVF